MQEAAPKQRIITLLGPTEEGHQLDATDALACRNLEIFETAPLEAHGISAGHVGLRCLNCAVNSGDGGMDTASYPSCIDSMASSVRMMTDWHIAACQYAPSHVGNMARAAALKRRAELEDRRRPSQEDERSLRALHDHCHMFCRNVGIGEKYPIRTGLIFVDENARPHDSAAQRASELSDSADRQSFDQHAGRHYPPSRTPMIAPFPNETVTATPLVRRSKSGAAPDEQTYFNELESSGPYSAFRPQYAPMGPRGMLSGQRDLRSPAPPRHDRPDSAIQPTPQSAVSHQTIQSHGESPFAHPSYDVSAGFPYWQDANGAWNCKYCSNFPIHYREHGYLWHPAGNAPPPTHYIDQHLSLCRGYQMPPPPYYQGHSHLHYGGYPPPVPHAYVTQYPPLPPGASTWAAGGLGDMPPPHPYISPHDEHPFRYPRPASPASVPVNPRMKIDSGSILSTDKATTGNTTLQPHRASKNSSASLNPPEINDAAISQAISLLATTYANRTYKQGLADGSDELVLGEDKLLLTEYFYHLMTQLRVCRFSEADRKTRGGKRENISIGYGGLQCIHCADASNSRKFFWSNVDRLANSFAEIPGHVLKCRRCPIDIKNALHELKRVHPEQMARLPRGSQKVFFRRMWRRLHDEDPEGAQGPGLTKGQQDDMRDAEPKDELTLQTEQDEPPADSPGTVASEDSLIIADRATDECAKALAESLAHPPSPNSRILLAIVEDTEWLSDMDCFIRRNLEVFCATEDDIEIASLDRKYPVSPGQVGIRCVHCARAKEVANGNAVSYPYSISGIYESVREFQRLHMESCPNLPSSAKSKLAGFKGSSSLSSVLRKYYVLAAKALGMTDTAEGIRSGGESVPLGNSVAFVFNDNTASSEKMGDSPDDSSLLNSTGTPLETRKRKLQDGEPGSGSPKKQDLETKESDEEQIQFSEV